MYYCILKISIIAYFSMISHRTCIVCDMSNWWREMVPWTKDKELEKRWTAALTRHAGEKYGLDLRLRASGNVEVFLCASHFDRDSAFVLTSSGFALLPDAMPVDLRAPRVSREVELRAERSEKQLDSKRGLNDVAEKEKVQELERKLAEASMKLEESAKREEKANSDIRELAREKEVLNNEVADLKKKIDHCMDSNDALQKRVAEESLQLEDVRRGAENSVTEKIELVRYNEVLKTEMDDMRKNEQERIIGLTNQLEEEKRRASDDRVMYCERIDELEKRLANDNRVEEERRKAKEGRAKYRAKIDELEKKLYDDERVEEERRRAKDDRAKYRARIRGFEQRLVNKDQLLEEQYAFAHVYRARINELTFQLAQYEGVLQPVQPYPWPLQQPPAQLQLQQLLVPPPPPPVPQQQPQQQQHQVPVEAAVVAHNSSTPFEIHDFGHPTDIFQLCRKIASESISYDSAREKLLSVASGGTDERAILIQRYDKLPPREKVPLLCRVCEATGNLEGIKHFLTARHKKKLATIGAYVSRAAIEYWVAKLQQVPSARPIQLSAAASAYLHDSDDGSMIVF